MALVKLGTKKVGSIVKLKENGTATNFIVVHQGKPSNLYDDSCNGTWLLRQDIYTTNVWGTSNTVNFGASSIKTLLNDTYLNLLDSKIQDAIQQAKIPYSTYTVNGSVVGAITSGAATVVSGSNGLSAKVFLLSAAELGGSTGKDSYVINDYNGSDGGTDTVITKGGSPADGDVLDYFDGADYSQRIAKYNGTAAYWWTRSVGYGGSTIYLGSTSRAWYVLPSGDLYHNVVTFTLGVRPALILDSTLLVSDDGTVVVNTAPTTPASITVPSTIMGGTSVKISWADSTDTEDNLAGYKLERSTDGGTTWTQVYQGDATVTTNTVAFGTGTVMYRVKAYDDDGLESGYATSSSVKVTNNQAPGAPSYISVPNIVTGGASLNITWGAPTDPDGDTVTYELERKANSTAWQKVYTGTALKYADSITKGWTTVQYRVRAYDKYSAYSAYTTGETRSISNNSAPTITSTAGSSGIKLGTKTAPFTFQYTVTDSDADTVTVTEAIDGVTVKTSMGVASGTTLTAESLSDADSFQKILNGSHTVTITASDGKLTATYAATFTKKVTACTVTLKAPIAYGEAITKAVLSVNGSIPTDATYTVKATNNGADEEPVWQDCTDKVKSGETIFFENTTAKNGFAFNFQLEVKEGSSGKGGYIQSVSGAFQ